MTITTASKSFLLGFVSGVVSAWIFLFRWGEEPELPSRPFQVVSPPLVSPPQEVLISSPILSDEEILAIGEVLRLETENNEWCEAARAHKSRSCDGLEFPDAKKQRVN